MMQVPLRGMNFLQIHGLTDQFGNIVSCSVDTSKISLYGRAAPQNKKYKIKTIMICFYLNVLKNTQ